MQFSDVFDDIPVGVCVVKRDRKTMDVLYINDSMCALLDASDVLGRDLNDVLAGQDAGKLVKSLKSTTPPDSYILPIERQDRETRWVKLDIVRGEWDGVDSYIFWATDISANKEAEEKLQDEVKKADAVAEMKSNFLATMSHEIRTPMQTIYGLLELIAEEKPQADILSMVETAKGAASGLLEILDDILDLAKMDADKMELDIFEVPVRMLVRGTLEALAVKVHGLKVNLIDDIAQDVPFVIIGDPKRLRQIMMNLAGNAIKFTDKGSVTVRVTTSVQNIIVPENHVGLRFEVIDTGMGMSEEVCSKLFGSFTQADNSTARKFGGTGLGLSISKKLVELMGGKIGVTSKLGKGSTFWFEIPTEEVGTETTTVELPKLDGISVISVEDHPQGAKEIVNSLRSMGATVESCPTLKEGLELIKRRPFDVGIIDQGLPDGLGLDLIRQTIEVRPYMGLIMYTVRDDVGLQHTLQSLGVTYLTKPASRAGLGEAVKEAASKASQISITGPTKLLIAEDTPSVQDVLKRQLDKLGVDAEFVANGEEALKELETGEYGILITDLHMPEVDGYALVNAIREHENGGGHFPVIVLTADVQMSQRDVYLRHGFDECLLKPVSLGKFKRLLIRWGLLNDLPDGEIIEDIEDSHPTNGQPPAIDLKAVEEQMGGMDDSVIEMLKMFGEMTEPIMEQITKAHEDGNANDLMEAAHSLKGAARSACCMVLGDLASQLQNEAHTGMINSNLISDIYNEFVRVKEAVASL